MAIFPFRQLLLAELVATLIGPTIAVRKWMMKNMMQPF